MTHGVARIKAGEATTLPLGNLEAQRDWGFAGDYVRAMWMMLQQDAPSDYVISTSRTHTVRRLCEIAFEAAGLNWEDHVVVDERFFRPAEVDLLLGDASKAKREINWQPKVTFAGLAKMMVDADLKHEAEHPR